MGFRQLVSRSRSYAMHLGRDLGRRVSPAHVRSDLRRLRRSLAASPPVSAPPHRLELYRSLLAGLVADPGCTFAHYPETVSGASDPDRVTVVLRHDVDYGDEAGTRALCRVERELGLRSAVHLLVDGSMYQPRALAAMAAELEADGFDVGLHSTAWVDSQPQEALFRELRTFEAAFGFPPATLSHHGVWPHSRADLWRRRWFTARLPSLTAGTSLVGYRHVFDWVSEDSNVAGRPAPLRQSFFEVAERCFLGGTALVLTHGGHWRPD